MLNDAMVPKIMANLCKIWAMPAVGPMYWAISAAAPFNNLPNTLPDHLFQVVVIDAMYLMIPLFKGHFYLSWHGITMC